MLLLTCTLTQAQYTVNGNAVQSNFNCYVLTNDVFNQSGSVWNNNKIDLSRFFNFAFNINLCCNAADADGADGIVFVLQPISTSIGSACGGLGYQNVSPAVGVTIHTWQNTDDSDPLFDHIAIQLNGNLNHSNSAIIAGPANNDLNNEVLHAIPRGIVKFNYFTIYNRLGQQVFTISNPTKD